MDYLLGVDLGTTGCKAGLYQVDGALVASRYTEYPLITLGPHLVEQDADLWWRLTQDVMRDVLLLAGVPGSDVQAVSVSSQGISFVPVDAEGLVLRNAISWLDTRAEAAAQMVQDELDDELLFQLTGKRPGVFYVLPKLLWLREHEPALYSRTFKFLMAHDFIVYRLCGVPATDYSLAGGSLLLDVAELRWCDQILERFDVNVARLPELRWAGSIAGEMHGDVAAALGLRAGTPVVVGGQDQKCAALGAGIAPGIMTVSLGTASAISGLVADPVLDSQRRVPTFPFVRQGLWDLEGVVSTAGAALKWAREVLFPACSYEELDAMAADSPPGANGVRFFPHLTGASSPWWDSSATGVFTGLTLASSGADIVRSILEGIAYQIHSNVTVIEPICGCREIVLFGGGAKSSLWSEIICRVTGKPVRVTEIVDVATWGACILAGIGVGVFKDFESVAPVMSQGRTYVPSASEDEYDELYADYVLLQERLVGV
jgi:xylulokinase